MATTDDLLKMTYSDIKTVKTRSCYQIVLEGPIEQMEAAMQLLGAPNPKVERWVAVALLSEDAAEARGGKYAQQAGIMCHQVAFQQFVEAKDEEAAAQFIRDHCGVLSRSKLDHNDAAAKKFLDLKSEYEFWLRDAA
jgi:hypothetical protein